MTQENRPILTLIKGGSEVTQTLHEMLIELMKPVALEATRYAALKARLEPRGQLSLAPPAAHSAK